MPSVVIWLQFRKTRDFPSIICNHHNIAGMNKMKKIVYAVAGLAAATMVSSAQAGTLEDVQARGVLNCIVSTGTPDSRIRMTVANGRALTSTSVVRQRPPYWATPTRCAMYRPPVPTVSQC